MTSVGVRELRQRASELLRLVEAGESIEITDRGRPVAVLGPIPVLQGLAQLRATGDLAVATERLDDLPEPVVVPADISTPTEVLARLRDDER